MGRGYGVIRDTKQSEKAGVTPDVQPLHRVGLQPVPVPKWVLGLQRAAVVLAATLVLAVTAMFAFLAIVPRTGLYATYSVMTASMAPGIPVGSIVVVVPRAPDEVRVGDVIAFTSSQPPYTSVTHRITQIVPTANGPEFKTKGDGNQIEDPWQFGYSGAAGKVILPVPLLGYVLALSATPWARTGLAGLAALLIAGFFLPAIWRARHEPAAAGPFPAWAGSSAA